MTKSNQLDLQIITSLIFLWRCIKNVICKTKSDTTDSVANATRTISPDTVSNILQKTPTR